MSAAAALMRRARPLLLRLMRGVLRNPRLKRHARQLLQHFPRLQARLHRLSYSAILAPEALSRPVRTPGIMSPRSARFHHDLKQALEARKK